MSDAADRLAQAVRELIDGAVQAAIERERPTLPPERVVERPKVPDEGLMYARCATRNICGTSCRSRKPGSSSAAAPCIAGI
jgi:hypothetical protein